MTTSTERANITRIQNDLGDMKAAAKEEIKGNRESGDAEHLNDWVEVHARIELLHSDLTRIGFRAFPEFFGGVVIEGGGGGR